MGRGIPKRRKFVKNYKSIFKLGNFSLIVVALMIFLFSTVLFLIQSNRVAVKGYEIFELEKRVAELNERNEKLQIEASKLQSVNKIKEDIKDKNMVPIGKINYVYPGQDVAFLRK